MTKNMEVRKHKASVLCLGQQCRFTVEPLLPLQVTIAAFAQACGLKQTRLWIVMEPFRVVVVLNHLMIPKKPSKSEWFLKNQTIGIVRLGFSLNCILNCIWWVLNPFVCLSGNTKYFSSAYSNWNVWLNKGILDDKDKIHILIYVVPFLNFVLELVTQSARKITLKPAHNILLPSWLAQPHTAPHPWSVIQVPHRLAGPGSLSSVGLTLCPTLQWLFQCQCSWPCLAC